MRYLTVSSSAIQRNSRHGEVVQDIFHLYRKIDNIDSYELIETFSGSLLINGACRLIYNIKSPLPNGARCWYEIPDEVEIQNLV